MKLIKDDLNPVSVKIHNINSYFNHQLIPNSILLIPLSNYVSFRVFEQVITQASDYSSKG